MENIHLNYSKFEDLLLGDSLENKRTYTVFRRIMNSLQYLNLLFINQAFQSSKQSLSDTTRVTVKSICT